MNKKAVVLYIVLATLLIVVILAGALLNFTVSHSRLTHHSASRIQAYYAALAGINYALEQVRTGSWSIPSSGNSYTRNLCRTCTPPNIQEPNLPASVSNVAILVADKDAVGCDPPTGISVCVSATSTYTYTMP